MNKQATVTDEARKGRRFVGHSEFAVNSCFVIRHSSF